MKSFTALCVLTFLHITEMIIPRIFLIYTGMRRRDGYFLRHMILTYSNSIGGEHATTVNGNGADPGMDDLLSVAKKIGLGMTKARKTAAEIQECVQERLRDYLSDRIE